MSLKKFDIIFSECERLGIKIKKLSDYVFKLSEEHLPKNKFIIIEPQEIYTNSQEAIKFFDELNKIDFENSNISDIERLPFFAGYSDVELGNFLSSRNEVKIEPFAIKIHFNILPADFNVIGLERFLNYLIIIQKKFPIFKGINNFDNYNRTINGEITRTGKIQVVIPHYLLDLEKSIGLRDGPISNIFKDAKEI
jgi:hypothetical protein